MRAYVFTDAALAKHAGRFVWLSMDTEKAEAEPFLEKFPIESWPTLLVIDPVTEKAELKWLGSASVPELENLLADGERAFRNEGEAALREADRLGAEDRPAEAAKLYRQLLSEEPPGAPRHDRVVESLAFALMSAHDDEGCARVAIDESPKMGKNGAYANVVATGLSCALEADGSPTWKKDAIAVLEPRVRESLQIPGLLADDRSGVYETLIEAREAAKDPEGARKLAAEWWQFLDAQAAAATSPEARAAFDPHRVLAAEKMGDPARVIPVLEASERDLPQDYNAPARLALVYRDLGRYDDALVANGRALQKVYGPRRIRLLEVQASLLQKKGDPAGAAKALDEAIQVVQSLPPAQRPKGALDRLRRNRDLLHP